MKKNLLITLLIIPFLAFSQTTKPIDGFLGIKFGTPQQEALAAIKAKGGTLLPDKGNAIIFQNVSLGHRPARQLNVYFNDGKLYAGRYFFKPENNQLSIEYYDSLVKDLTDIYGKGVSYRNFKSPFTDGDGHEVSAIEGSYATIATTWTDDKKSIQVRYYVIKDDIYIILNYQDDAMAAEADAKEKQKEKSDF